MFNLRWVLAFALVALPISLIAGVIGGLPFGRILLRALIGTAAFAAVGVVLVWVVQKFLPELLQLRPGGKPERDSSGAEGEEVDITLPEENPHTAAEGPDEFEGISDSELNPDAGFGPYEQPEPGSSRETTDESEHEGSVPEVETADGRWDDPLQEELTSNLPDVDLDDDFGGVDVLPTADSISDGSGPSADSTNSGGRGIELMGEDHDPATAAKAIQTWLKKDKEG